MFRVYLTGSHDYKNFDTRADVWKYVDEDLADIHWNKIRVEVFDSLNGTWERMLPCEFSIKFGVR